MDLDLIYYEMCKTSKEIQSQRGGVLWEWGDYWMDDILIKKNMLGVIDNNIDDLYSYRHPIWLPRADQLMAMIEGEFYIRRDENGEWFTFLGGTGVAEASSPETALLKAYMAIEGFSWDVDHWRDI